MTSFALKFLLSHLPEWIRLENSKESEFEITACPKLADGDDGESFDLIVREINARITISEKEVGKKLPTQCPERHINKGGTFCLELDLGQSIDSGARAIQWWQWLNQYLIIQQTTAKKLRIWPKEYALAHGKAAKYQLEIEEAAKQLGWSEEVLEKILRKKQKILFLLSTHKQKGMIFLRKRAACPWGCSRKGKPIRINKCNHVDNLLAAERDFHESEKAYVEELKKQGFQCCKTMRNCSFNNENNHEI